MEREKASSRIPEHNLLLAQHVLPWWSSKVKRDCPFVKRANLTFCSTYLTKTISLCNPSLCISSCFVFLVLLLISAHKHGVFLGVKGLDGDKGCLVPVSLTIGSCKFYVIEKTLGCSSPDRYVKLPFLVCTRWLVDYVFYCLGSDRNSHARLVHCGISTIIALQYVVGLGNLTIYAYRMRAKKIVLIRIYFYHSSVLQSRVLLCTLLW